MRAGRPISQDWTSAGTLRREAARLGVPLRQVGFKDSIAIGPPGGYIINLQTAARPAEGTHWTAVWRDPRGDVYFDSYGFPPPVAVEQQLSDPYYYTSQQIQAANGGGCGSYVMEFLQWMHERAPRHRDLHSRFAAFLGQFTRHPDRNRTVLKRLELD